MARYNDPVNLLLILGEETIRSEPEQWFDYVTELGLTDVHVDDLIRMATDDVVYFNKTIPEYQWGPIHAWRALAQLGAVKASRPLLSLYSKWDDDWVCEELQDVLGILGPETLPDVAAMMRKYERQGYPAIYGTDCVRKVVDYHPDVRDEAIAVLVNQLQRYKRNAETLNGFLISILMDLNIEASLPLIEEAFAADAVDVTIAGDWEDVQVDFGILEARITPKPNYMLQKLFGHALDGDSPERTDEETQAPVAKVSYQPVKSQSPHKRKAKRKQAKDSRKKNRRRK